MQSCPTCYSLGKRGSKVCPVCAGRGRLNLEQYGAQCKHRPCVPVGVDLCSVCVRGNNACWDTDNNGCLRAGIVCRHNDASLQACANNIVQGAYFVGCLFEAEPEEFAKTRAARHKHFLARILRASWWFAALLPRDTPEKRRAMNAVRRVVWLLEGKPEL